MANKKIPMRMCVGCREMKPKTELVRVVRTTDGEIKLDFTGKLNGRGAYICKDNQCLKKAEKSSALQRAFEVNVSKEIYQTLSEEISGDE
ncbi:MAG: YlxR family protein [Oscillospiraceae bacterium]|nr:YlxR family protein [Oscillospiraceae bacterium]